MPRVNITEVDLTSPGQLNILSNVVYVPGFARRLPASFKGKPMLFTSLSAFQQAFAEPNGDTKLLPPQIYDSNTVAYDSGYIYAHELLSLGIPVLYDAMYSYTEPETPNNDASLELLCGNGDLVAVYVKVSNDYVLSYYKPNDARLAYGVENAQNTQKAAAFICDRLNTDELKQKGLYNIKFISNGGYRDSSTLKNSSGQPLGLNGIANLMINTAAVRGDCVAIVDHPSDRTSDTTDTSVYEWAQTIGSENGKYGALFTPDAVYAPPCIASPKAAVNSLVLPASFGYLLAMANSTLNNPDWLAVAGSARGNVPYIVELINPISETLSDGSATTGATDKVYSNRDKVAINPIMNINPFGIIIWGNRTLYDNSGKGNLTASSFLNIRNLCSNVKKTIWTAARTMTFEQNGDILWVKFKSLITPTLDQMVSGNGLAGYELKKRVAKQKATLSAVIRLYAIEAVEDFELEVQLADDSTAIIE